ncbi:hypothetical protein [Candidatus Rhabdochlamydia sp. T3358]|uniref:hypothetical protein n=1 Tax=Candidatus Rhabdochlamydia sp. T3358 TaxID=2099795 RepID=UPI0010B814CD|nr:hypothetical protein [Candidatus Rhabdochlamydia sp. T3358]VHN99522.1 hypothetical protein RHT_00032 [Candidatus Rhabdochlamydia sp. T3358]
MEEWSLQQKIGIFIFGVPIMTFLCAFIFLKLADWTYDGWRNNNLKKKWAVCLIIGFYFIFESIGLVFPGILDYLASLYNHF